MAYTLESLKQVIDQVLSCGILDEKPPQLESLLEKVTILKDFLERSWPVSSEITESLEIQIRYAVNKAENIIDLHIADQFLEVGINESLPIFSRNLQELIEEFESMMEQLIKITGEAQNQNLQKNNSPSPSVSLRPDSSRNNTMVGYDEDINQLKERLTRQKSNTQIIPIVGMGGIGKTTLARTLYDDPDIVYHFDTRAWVTMSQKYDVGEILLGLLDCMRNLDEEMRLKKYYELGEHLHKSLKDRRYLIVLDDMWSTKAWDNVKSYFPDDAIGSRIIITTRESTVANNTNPSCSHHQMHFLSEDESWNFLCKKVFAKEHCPLEFEDVGKNIARSCAGLPLAISVMAGVLTSSRSVLDVWKNVERNIISVAERSDEHFSKILSLSYNHLPHHLKPCFLYMGSFPEDEEIRASKIIRLWAAEGFLRCVEDKCWEEVAEVYLKALVDRNLILVCQKETSGQAKTYKIHDLLRNLCIRKASEEKFIVVVGRRFYETGEENVNMVRLNADSSCDVRLYSPEIVSFSRSFVCFSWISNKILSSVLNVRLLKVLDIFKISFFELPEEIMQLVNLRFLAFKCRWGLSSSISRLWNLQTLIFCQNFTNSRQDFTAGRGNIPLEIWNMMQLRHIKFKETSVWIEQDYGDDFVQRNLQTLSTIRLLGSRSRKLLERFPNLKKLGIICDAIKVDFGFLQKLETLKCSSDLKPGARVCRSNFTFPHSLKKLTLSGFIMTKKIMATVGSLPNLEVLKLRHCEFQSPKELEWEQGEGEMFCQLQYLLLESLDIVNWCDDYAYFPTLRSLVIRHCKALEGIPSGLGEIQTLELIEMVESSPSAVSAARKIQEEQLDLGNDGLQVHIYGAS